MFLLVLFSSHQFHARDQSVGCSHESQMGMFSLSLRHPAPLTISTISLSGSAPLRRVSLSSPDLPPFSQGHDSTQIPGDLEGALHRIPKPKPAVRPQRTW